MRFLLVEYALASIGALVGIIGALRSYRRWRDGRIDARTFTRESVSNVGFILFASSLMLSGWTVIAYILLFPLSLLCLGWGFGMLIHENSGTSGRRSRGQP